MNIVNFDYKYKDKGGFRIIKEMMASNMTKKSIALHFGVSTPRVKQWIEDLTGERYDPRRKRRAARIEESKKILKEIGLEKAKKIYRNHYYLKLAAKELNLK